MSEFNDAVGVIVEELRDQAEALSATSGRSVLNCYVSLLRKPIQWYLEPDLKPVFADHRQLNWNVQLRFWDVNEGADRATDLEYTEAELVRGFDGIEEYILDWIMEMHEKSGEDIKAIPEFSSTSLKKRLGGMRPAISKGGGSAGSNIRYMVGDWHYMAQLEISREDVPLTDIDA